jgi:hypothetical protein
MPSPTAGILNPVEALLLLIVGAVASVVIGRGYNVPRDVRRNDTRIRNADEDLATWIDDEDKGQRLALIRSIQERREAHRKGTPDYSLTQLQSAKNEALHRYRDQRRGAERLVTEIEDEEQLPHRLWRRAQSRRVPQLGTPEAKAKKVAQWEQTAEELEEKTQELRAFAEDFRRQRAEENGEPPPPPLDL